MSHIPANAMPHARADEDPGDDGHSASGPATPPLASEAPATATGNREGGAADKAARAAGEPPATAGAGQPAVDGTVTAQDAENHGRNAERQARTARTRSRVGAAAFALGGLALAGGVAALLFPRKQAEKPKGKRMARPVGKRFASDGPSGLLKRIRPSG